MDQWQWLFIGGSTALAVITAGWQQVRNILSYVSSYAVTSCTLRDNAAMAMLAYLSQTFYSRRLGMRSYCGWHEFVRPLDRVHGVVAEELGQGVQLYWKGWRPLWITRGSFYGDRDSTHPMTRPVIISFIRGAFDPDELAQAATDHLQELTAGVKDGYHTRTRYAIHRYHGTAGRTTLAIPQGALTQSSPSSTGQMSVDNAGGECFQVRLLKWTFSDLGPRRNLKQKAVHRLALPEEASEAVVSIRRWLNGRDWHRERSVPWRLGFCFSGSPGTGKTALVRALAEDFDMPVCAFDLATFHNDELRDAWEVLQDKSPCIVLVEDIDTVFNGRETIKGPLTFDCLLNCIDGVEQCDGLLLIITTNNIEKLDSALCSNGNGATSRPGRIDRVIHMPKLSEDGRKLIAARILSGWPAQQAEAVQLGDGDSGAQFERRCVDMAMPLFWESLE